MPSGPISCSCASAVKRWKVSDSLDPIGWAFLLNRKCCRCYGTAMRNYVSQIHFNSQVVGTPTSPKVILGDAGLGGRRRLFLYRSDQV